MASPLPKSLHPVAGKPMLARILTAVSKIKPRQVRIVTGRNADLIHSVAKAFRAFCFQQDEDSWGTAKALLAAKPEEMKGDILVINGDHPLISAADLTHFVHSSRNLAVDASVASFKDHHSKEFGRMVFEAEQLTDIVEPYELEKLKNVSERSNAGIYFIKAELACAHLNEVKKNVKEEHNLTDLISILHKKGRKLRAVDVSWGAAFGVNSQRELSVASSLVFEGNSLRHMAQGVVIMDFKNCYIEDEVRIGKGSLIYPGVYLKGKSSIGLFCALEPNVYISDSIIKNYVTVKAGSYIEGAVVGEKSLIGPYAHLRPETLIGKQCRVGNFVEMKKSQMGDQSKAAHLSYLGDTEIGKNVNIGCGTVTCNYSPDKKKHKTIIKDHAFIGSGTQLIAPITIGASAVIGAGSAIAKDVPSGNLALARPQQTHIKDYQKEKNST